MCIESVNEGKSAFSTPHDLMSENFHREQIKYSQIFLYGRMGNDECGLGLKMGIKQKMGAGSIFNVNNGQNLGNFNKY